MPLSLTNYRTTNYRRGRHCRPAHIVHSNLGIPRRRVTLRHCVSVRHSLHPCTINYTITSDVAPRIRRTPAVYARALSPRARNVTPSPGHMPQCTPAAISSAAPSPHSLRVRLSGHPTAAPPVPHARAVSPRLQKVGSRRPLSRCRARGAARRSRG